MKAAARTASPSTPRRAPLLQWYRRHRRDLPWRRTRDPYAIWVSEIMLQQTRVDTVIPFYERFLERFPTVIALAGARESHVLAAWSGLGYYRRARNLHAAAAVVARAPHGGVVPRALETLESLPGVGAYTAAAIASIAFDIPAAAVDGNVIRVIARWEGLEGSRDDVKLRRAVTERAVRWAPGARPGDWTQALMELGATVCLPREPLCERCPVSRWCAAYESGNPDRYPDAAKSAAVRREHRVLLLVRRRARILLPPDPADDGVTLALPSAAVRDGADPRRVANALARAHGGEQVAESASRTFRHRTFSHDYSVEVWETPAKPADSRERGARWSSRTELSRLPLRAITLKAVKGL